VVLPHAIHVALDRGEHEILDVAHARKLLGESSGLCQVDCDAAHAIAKGGCRLLGAAGVPAGDDDVSPARHEQLGDRAADA
jgi:hypothetical protein